MKSNTLNSFAEKYADVILLPILIKSAQKDNNLFKRYIVAPLSRTPLVRAWRETPKIPPKGVKPSDDGNGSPLLSGITDLISDTKKNIKSVVETGKDITQNLKTLASAAGAITDEEGREKIKEELVNAADAAATYAWSKYLFPMLLGLAGSAIGGIGGHLLGSAIPSPVIGYGATPYDVVRYQRDSERRQLLKSLLGWTLAIAGGIGLPYAWYKRQELGKYLQDKFKIDISKGIEKFEDIFGLKPHGEEGGLLKSLLRPFIPTDSEVTTPIEEWIKQLSSSDRELLSQAITNIRQGKSIEGTPSERIYKSFMEEARKRNLFKNISPRKWIESFKMPQIS